MGRLVETMFGLLLFAAFIVVFQIQAFVGFMDSYFFAQQTTEMTQRIKEDGGFGSSASAYAQVLQDKGISYTIKDENGQAVTDAAGYTGKNLYITYDHKLEFQYGYKEELEMKRTDIVFVTKRN